MKKLDRLPLDEAVTEALGALTAAILAVPEDKQAAEAKRLWQTVPKATKQPVAQALAAMCSGRQRCMYCEDSQGTDVEHFRPKSRYPAYTFEWLNHLLACSYCNRRKGSTFPLDDKGRPLLLDPTVDEPSDHLRLSPTTGLWVGADDRGTTTVEVCGLNRDTCAKGRRNAWSTFECLVEGYARAMREAKPNRARAILEAVHAEPFQSVRTHLIRTAREAPRPEDLISEDVLAALATFPELAEG